MECWNIGIVELWNKFDIQNSLFDIHDSIFLGSEKKTCNSQKKFILLLFNLKQHRNVFYLFSPR